MTALARKRTNNKLQTRPLVTLGVPHQQTSDKNLVMGPRFTPNTMIDWPTDRR
jgi:hypothetical protein